MSAFKTLVASIFTLLLCGPSASMAAERPKVGLVLGGGGARGAAHIGVLEVLEQLRIPVDCVAGTSMGALVAGAWVSGLDAATLRSEMGKADWNDLFQDNPGYNDINYRTKRLAKRYLPGSEAGVTATGLVTPPGVVSGQKIKLFFNQLVHADAGDRLIEQLALPVSIIATDIGTGARVVFREGSLTLAMRASMSVPGLMAPLEYEGRKLVDGGLVDNLPIQEVRDLCGAQVVIAVNVGSPLMQASEISGLLSVSTQMVSILTEQNVTQSLAKLGADDIYIKPDLTGLTAAQFDRSGEAADQGRTAAQAATALQGLTVAPQAYALWRQRWASADQPQTRVDAIEIAGLKAVNPAVVERYLEQKPGERLNVQQLNRNLLRAYGDGYYERVDYTLTREGDKNLLRVTPIEKAWGPDYLRLGLNLNSTLTGRSTFSLRAAYQRTWLNSLGAELLASAELGSNTGIGAELYQPLDPAQRFFVYGAASVRREDFALFVNDLRISDYRNSIGRLDLAAGLNLGMTGQTRLGWRDEHQTASIETGLPILPTDPLHIRGWLASWETDQKNQLHIATTGWSGKGSWFESAAGDYNKLNLNLEGSYQLQDWVLGLRGSYVGSIYGALPPQEMGRMGGFLNLSGFANDQLMGDRVSYGHVRAERIMGRMPMGLSGDLRLGFALEVGKVADPMSEPRRTGLLNSTAIYVRGETPFGPAYIGLGQSSSGPVNAYFFIGTP
ncbi:MAG: patatin-like phospholipase family protein [Burkholderiales bacterium]